MEENKPHYLLVFVAIIAAYVVSNFLLALLFINNGNFNNSSIFDIAAYAPLLEVLVFFLPLFFLKDASDKTLYGLCSKFKISVMPSILWSIVGILLFNGGLITIIGVILPTDWYYSNLQEYIEVTTTMMQSNSVKSFIINTVGFAVIPAICEEALFRGYLLQNILRKHSPIVAVFLSAFAFAIVHFEPIAFLELFVVGVFLGFIYLKTRSLLPGVILHFINNFIVILSANFGQQGYLNNELDLSIWFSLVLLIVGGVVMYFSYRKIEKYPLELESYTFIDK